MNLNMCMNDYLKKIISDNNILKNEVITKINAGFTNLIYSADDKYIIKICKNKGNEERFNNEIEFYIKNKNNEYIPKLYAYYISKNKDDYSYEIIEKINGKTLYYVWGSFSETRRKDTIKEIVKMMKSLHKIKDNKYNFGLYIKEKLERNFNKCFELNLFNEEEKRIATKILNNTERYLKSDDLRLVHSDIHFDNIIYQDNGKIKIIDFETSLFAPIDYELDIFLRMCHNPLKYASEDEEKLINVEDYENIEKYFKKFYPEIYQFDNFDTRHELYDLEANLRLLPRFPANKDLKDNVISIMKWLDEVIC